MYIAKSRFLVVGLGLSGVSATKALIARGGKCMVYDSSQAPHILRNKQELLELGAIDAYQDLDEAVKWADVVVLSPGVPIDNKIPVFAKRLNKRIIGELELGSMLVNSPIVAVTGTNGKTTTCSLISEVLSKAEIKNMLVGNIGAPICDCIEDLTCDTFAVCEVSSFQLETVHSFCPHVAVVLNITPDHLSRHYNMENYVYLKNRLLFNMRESEYAVLNYDDETVRRFSKNSKCQIEYFSTKEKVSGAYLLEDCIYYKGELIMPKSSISLSGEHNVQNVLASICVCKILGLDNATISGAISNFNGVKHRIEFVKEIDGVDFYNDSKSTNIDSTINAVNTMTKDTVLILGGKDKGLEYDQLFREISKKVSHAILTGENRFKLLDSARRVGFERVTVTPSFTSAVRIAMLECESGGAVLLSPATSSFDAFSSFEERGNAFISLVNEFDE